MSKRNILFIVSCIMMQFIKIQGCPGERDALGQCYEKPKILCFGNCSGDNNIELNAVGDKSRIDTSNVQFNNLGQIKKSQIINLDTPTQGNHVGYKAQFPDGEIKDEIEFLSVYGTEGNQILYKFYRKTAKDKLWTEVGEFTVNEPVKKITVDISSDGVISFIGKNDKYEKMYIATKNLIVPRLKMLSNCL